MTNDLEAIRIDIDRHIKKIAQLEKDRQRLLDLLWRMVDRWPAWNSLVNDAKDILEEMHTDRVDHG